MMLMHFLGTIEVGVSLFMTKDLQRQGKELGNGEVGVRTNF